MSIMRIGILARAVAFIADSDVTVLWDGSLQAGPPGGSTGEHNLSKGFRTADLAGLGNSSKPLDRAEQYRSGSSLAQAKQGESQAPADDTPPRWRNLLTIVMIITLSVLGTLIIAAIAILFIYRAVDRAGVDEGKELPEVSADVAKEAGRTAEVGYDTETSQDISIWQGFSGYEATVGERCGVGMQGYVALQHRLIFMFLGLPMLVISLMVYNSMGSGKMIDVPMGQLTMANVDPVHVNTTVTDENGVTTATLSYSNADKAITWLCDSSIGCKFFGSAEPIKPAAVAAILAINDAMLGLMIFVFLVYMFYWAFPNLQAARDADNVDTSHFSIRIDQLPPRLREGDEQYESKLRTAVVEHVESASGIEGAEIVEMTVIRKGYSDAVALLSQIEQLESDAEMEREKHRSEVVKSVEEKIAAAKAELAELPDPKTGPVVRAFAILADFNHAQSAPGRLASEPFDGAVVSRAPEPEDVYWLHQSDTRGQRIMGFVISAIIKLAFYGTVFMLGATLMQMKAQSTNEAECLAADTGEVRDPGRTELLAAYNSTSATPIGISPYKTQHCLCRGMGVVAIFQDKDLWRPCDTYMYNYMISKLWLAAFLLMTVVLMPVVRFVFNFLEVSIECPITYSERNNSAFVSHVFLVFLMKFVLVALVLSKPLEGPYDIDSHELLFEVAETIFLSTAIMVVAQLWIRFFFGVIIPFLGSLVAGPFLFSHQKTANAVASFRPPFEPAERLAELAGLLGGVIVFSALVPCLVGGCFLFIIVLAFMDRVFLMRGASRKELAVDLSQPYSALWWIMFCVYLHGLLSAYVFGNPLLFPGSLIAYDEKKDAGYNLPSSYMSAPIATRIRWHATSWNAFPGLFLAWVCVVFAIVALVLKLKKVFGGTSSTSAGGGHGLFHKQVSMALTKFSPSVIKGMGKRATYVPDSPKGMAEYLGGTLPAEKPAAPAKAAPEAKQEEPAPPAAPAAPSPVDFE